MVAGQHKLSRRSLLAGACALPLARHCEERSDAAAGDDRRSIQCGVPTDGVAGLLRCARNDEK
jgi:hypothetical protein